MSKNAFVKNKITEPIREHSVIYLSNLKSRAFNNKILEIFYVKKGIVA
ncbi:hypothetical protein HMPREF0027_1935 [Actinobacillus ureae ATCC 25976]|uniref:Uncharacterized protein n=1 Tax=Actinobacillus ureae ATCC 25976 TaxID=887324 RepID=E8KJB8_9PAST|nr:hypothetical protein HMPREF0027_1935 [Actinobacillus ureae ATCC 25976]